MSIDDFLMYAFLLSFFVSTVEFLVFGIMKITEYYSTNIIYFYTYIAGPAVALLSLVMLISRS